MTFIRVFYKEFFSPPTPSICSKGVIYMKYFNKSPQNWVVGGPWPPKGPPMQATYISGLHGVWGVFTLVFVGAPTSLGYKILGKNQVSPPTGPPHAMILG